jgi:Zn-dependent protease with chaperone function
MTLGFYAFALGLVAVLGLFIWWEVTASGHHHVNGRGVIGSAIAIGVIVWSVTPRIDRFPDPGVPLVREQEPKLWRLIEEVAQATAQPMPADVFLVGDVNAFVAQRGGLMGIGSRRVLGIGLPLLQLLTVAQVRAVLAHEFGHFHGGDTKLGPWIYKTRGAIVRTVNNFARVGSLLQLPFKWYAKVFLRITQAISRRQELAADALSVQVTGRGPVRAALSTVAETAPLFEYYIHNEFMSMVNGGVRPPLAEGFRRFLRSPSMVKARAEVASHALSMKADPYDTHPPLGERLAAVGEAEEARGTAIDEVPAITLLRELPQLERSLLMFVTSDAATGKLPATSWEAAPGRVLPRLWRAVTFDHCLGLPAMTVADFAAQRDLGQLVRALKVKGGDADERRQRAAWMLGAMLAFRLHENGFRVDAQPGHPIRLVRGESKIEPFAALSAVEGGIADADWRQRTAALGIADLPLTGAAARPAVREA